MLKKFSLLRSFTFGIWVTSQFITCILSPAFSAEKFKQNHGVVVILQSPLVASPRISEEIQDDPGTIIGIVREKESRRPVENVQVYIPSLKTGAVSQADGRFALNEVPAGVYTLKIRMLGYERITIDSLVVKAGAKVEIAPELVLKVYEVHEIQVTASRHEALAQSIPQLVSVVSRQKIRDRAISQTPEVLREEMGVVVQKTSNSGGSPIIRGLRANKILLLVDGIRMNNATYRGGNLHYLNTLNPGAIERMEVVHGPSSVLYGSDALGGTINTLTITPPFSVDDKLEFDGAAGTGFSSADETKYLNLHATASGRKWSLFTGFSLYSSGDVRRGSSWGDEMMQRLRSSPEAGRNLAKV
ncbi:MAG: TonB-dependent receptor, partial [Calditrichaeota bacterium]